MGKSVYGPHYNDEQVAQVCHEANRAFQEVQDDPRVPVSKPWESLDTETRNSVIDGVRAMRRDGLTAAESHENWVRYKVSHGWVYGAVKDTVVKTHPCLVPYEELPVDQRVKDHLFRSIVWALT